MKEINETFHFYNEIIVNKNFKSSYDFDFVNKEAFICLCDIEPLMSIFDIELKFKKLQNNNTKLSLNIHTSKDFKWI